jgi:NADH dehydrogenase
MEKPKKQQIVILGGGFGGIKAALELAGHENFEVNLISDQDSFRYYPTLYKMATGAKIAGSSISLAEIFENKGVNVIKDKAKVLDRRLKRVRGASGKSYPYDILIVALGVVTNYFGIAGLAENSYGIKSQAEAAELKRHLHEQLLHPRKPELNYVVIGAGPTGVELAGSLPGYIRHIMKKHGMKEERRIHVDLIEAMPRLMPRMPKAYSRAVRKRLEEIGVELYLGKTVQAQEKDQLMVDGKPIKSHTVIWTAGVTNHPFLKENKFDMTKHGKAFVDQYLQVEKDVYVIGDNAETPYSGMAQTALHDGKFVADNLKRQAQGKKLKSYKPKKPIYVTPVGPGWAALLWNKTQVYGWMAWAMRDAADFIGFHDYEPWWESSQHWLALHQDEDACPVCDGEEKVN